MLRPAISSLLLLISTTINGLNITSYSNVSKWSPSYIANEARSSGQSFYTQSSDASVESKHSNTKNTKMSNLHKLQNNNNNSRRKTDIIQKRFNPPPYFDATDVDYSKPSIVYSSPMDNFQQSYPQSEDSKQNSYDSSVSSYHPAPSGIPADLKPAVQMDTTKNIAPNNDINYSYTNLNDNSNNIAYTPNHKKNKFPSYVYDHPSQEEKSTTSKYLGPYAPSYDDNSEDVSSYLPPLTKEVSPPSDNHDSNENMYGYNEMPKEERVVPPPSGDYSDSFPKNIPEYLDHNPYGSQYGFDHNSHHDHHVYHQVTTTTTSAPENERVNKGHYSYYYLGRKLWYIPLYFSIYFIIYITILILKSIARHKVNFAHDLHDAVKGRSFNDNQLLNESTSQVLNSIHNFRNQYIAM